MDFKEKSVFWTYIAIVLGAAYLSHFYFEKPAMKWLRERLLERGTSTAEALPAPAEEVKAAAN